MDVNINYLNNAYFHTISCGNDKNPPMLLIHGYFSTGIMNFLSMIKGLSKYYKLYIIDFIGCGSSYKYKLTN